MRFLHFPVTLLKKSMEKLKYFAIRAAYAVTAAFLVILQDAHHLFEEETNKWKTNKWK